MSTVNLHGYPDGGVKPPMDCTKPPLSPKSMNVNIAAMARKAQNSLFHNQTRNSNELSEKGNYQSNKME